MLLNAGRNQADGGRQVASDIRIRRGGKNRELQRFRRQHVRRQAKRENARGVVRKKSSDRRTIINQRETRRSGPPGMSFPLRKGDNQGWNILELRVLRRKLTDPAKHTIDLNRMRGRKGEDKTFSEGGGRGSP